MQERDEDLAQAYDEIDELEKTVLKKDVTINKMLIAIIVMGVVILGAVAFFVVKLVIRLKTGVKL
jgi:hypothetical protein